MPKLHTDYPRPASTSLPEEDFIALRELHPDVNTSEMLRRAVRYYLEAKNVKVKPN
jgi:hypothetical protein